MHCSYQIVAGKSNSLAKTRKVYVMKNVDNKISNKLRCTIISTEQITFTKESSIFTTGTLHCFLHKWLPNSSPCGSYQQFQELIDERLAGDLNDECSIGPVFVLRSLKFQTLKRKSIVLRKLLTTASTVV